MSSTSATIPVGYKQTEVGVIPEDWDVEILSQFVIDHKSGIFKNKTEYGSGTNIVGVANIYDIECIDGQEFNLVNLSNSEISQYTLKENDLLYNESSLVKEGIARTVFVTENGEGTAFAWHTRKFSVDQKQVYSPYLYFYLQSKPARKFLESVCIQTALTGINTVQYFRCPLVLPAIREQQIIAEAISDFSNLIYSLESLISKKRNIKQGTIQELLTGKSRLPGFTTKWKKCTLMEAGSITMGQSPPGNSYTDDFHNKPLINGAVELTKKGIQITKYTNKPTRLSKIGDFLFCIRATIGNLQISDKIYCLGRGVASLTPNENYSKTFIYHALNNLFQEMKENSEGGVILGLKKVDVENFPFMTPESFEEQEAIGNFLTDMDTEIAALERRLEKSKAIKQGMMQQLLTGRIRLVDPSTPVEVSA